MSVSTALQTYVSIFTAELPDKTMIATVLLVTKYRRPLLVWLGATGAFTVHVVVAVGAGTLISKLPATPVHLVVAALFLVGAVTLFRAARGESDSEDGESAAEEPGATAWATVVGSFGLVVLAEWGDLTQLATAALAARSDAPLQVGVGALAALASVAAIAATVGRQLVARVSLARINYCGALVFAALGLWALIDVIR